VIIGLGIIENAPFKELADINSLIMFVTIKDIQALPKMDKLEKRGIGYSN
jgi:hypothetical protein